MANRPYLLGDQHWTNGDLSWLSDNIKVAGCSSSYTPDTSASGDEFLSDIPGGAIVCTSGNLASKTNVGGALDAADVTISAVTGSTIIQWVLYNDTGTAATSELIAIYDTASSGLPLVPNGGPVTLQWAGAPNFVLAFYRERQREESLMEWIKRKLLGRWLNLPGGLLLPGEIKVVQG